MTEKNFRKDLDLVVDQNLNELVKETLEYDYAIKKAKDKSKAQIWIALALLNNKIKKFSFDNNNKNYKSKIPKEELSKIIDTLEKL